LTTFQVQDAEPLLGREIAQSTLKLEWGGLLDSDGILIAKIAQDSAPVCFERLCHWSSLWTVYAAELVLEYPRLWEFICSPK
jgi:hypothetical protein